MNNRLAIAAVLLMILFAKTDFRAQDVAKTAPGKTKQVRRVINATVDKTGQHPGTAAISGPARIVCLTAISNSPNPQPKPTCFLQAPGFSGNLEPPSGEAGASGAGTVILNCNGQGDFLRCSASVQ